MVTGANRGIGLEVCRQLAVNGITVVLTALDEGMGAEAIEKLKGLALSDVLFHQLDITDVSSIARVANFLNTRFGKLDILVSLCINSMYCSLLFSLIKASDSKKDILVSHHLLASQKLDWPAGDQ